jgi:hypothetical protein
MGWAWAADLNSDEGLRPGSRPAAALSWPGRSAACCCCEPLVSCRQKEWAPVSGPRAEAPAVLLTRTSRTCSAVGSAVRIRLKLGTSSS